MQRGWEDWWRFHAQTADTSTSCSGLGLGTPAEPDSAFPRVSRWAQSRTPFLTTSDRQPNEVLHCGGSKRSRYICASFISLSERAEPVSVAHGARARNHHLRRAAAGQGDE